MTGQTISATFSFPISTMTQFHTSHLKLLHHHHATQTRNKQTNSGEEAIRKIYVARQQCHSERDKGYNALMVYNVPIYVARQQCHSERDKGYNALMVSYVPMC